MIKVGIIGAAGYTAGELIRILINHPEVEIALVQSESQSGKIISDIHQGLVGETDLRFSRSIDFEDLDVIFLCKGHGESSKIIAKYPAILQKKIIDLSQDFRLNGNHDFVYGLPEVNLKEVSKSSHLANPGCFATCIQLGLIPAVKSSLNTGDISISGITGSTGAGQSLTATSHFSWRSNNASVYKPLEHQHLHEIGQTLKAANPEFSDKLFFVPYRGAFTRGIITTSHFETYVSQNELIDAYKDLYKDSIFSHVVDHNPDLKQVVGTNKCLIFPRVIDGVAIIVSVIDNLIKGASGQAIQNMNLLCGFEESLGLKLKSTAF